eukprot:SAG11_NODE_12680_length_691_cov_0.689189_1_plen_23_part_10
MKASCPVMKANTLTCQLSYDERL